MRILKCRRSLSIFVLTCFLSSGQGVPLSLAAPFQPETTLTLRAFPADLAKITVPAVMGKIEEVFKGQSDKVVVLVQDAHAIPAAQRNIQRLIEHFQKQYGVNLVALEGANAQLLRFHHLMDRKSGRYYEGNPGGDYETPWKPSTTRETETSGRPSFEARLHLRFGRQDSERLNKFLSPLAPSLRQEGAGRLEAQGASRTNPAFVGKAEEDFGAHSGERAPGSRLFNGPLDFETNRPSGPQELRSTLLYGKPLESDEPLGLERSKATEAGSGTQRESDWLLEASRLAAYKKKPDGLKPASSSLMKADSRLSPTSREPGRLEEKPQLLLSLGNGQRYRLSPPLRSRPRENVLASAPVFMPTETFGPNRSANSSGIFAARSEARLFSFAEKRGHT